jgi:hypothetical protein
MKNIFLAFAAFTAFSIGSCKKEDKAPDNSASVMFVNGCAGTDKVYVSSNGATIQSATNLAFQKNTGYQYVTAGANNLTYYLTNIGTPLTAASTSFTANAHYSVFAGGIITAPSMIIITDDRTAPAAGKAKIRFVNLCNDTLSETVTVGTINIATGITANSYSSFAEVAPGSYTIKAGDPADISTVVTVGPQQLDAGRSYTIMLTGILAGTGTSALTLTIINN